MNIDPLFAWIIALILLLFALWVLNKLCGEDPTIPYRRKPRIGFTNYVTFFINNTKVGGFMAEINVQGPSVGQNFFGHIDPKFNGVEVPIQEGSEVFSSSDESIFTIIPNPKNARYFIGTLTGKVGEATVNISIDDDPGEGTVPFTDVIKVKVLPGLANDMGTVIDAADSAPDPNAGNEAAQ